MKRILYFLLLFISFSATAAWDKSVLVGEWERYKYGYNHTYQYLKINDDFSGVYNEITPKSETYTIKFSKTNITFHEGYVVLTLEKNLKLLLSAWGSRETGYTTRLLGQSFIYTVEGDEIKLINTIPLSFNSATNESILSFKKKIEDEKAKSR